VIETRDACERARMLKPIHKLVKGSGQYNHRVYAEHHNIKNMFSNLGKEVDNDAIAKLLRNG